MTKKDLRCKYKAVRSNIADRDLKTDIIVKMVIDCSLFKNSAEVFLYFPSGTETSTFKIFEAAVESGKKTAFPKCIDSDGKMEFYYVRTIEEMTVGMYGIYEPDTSVCPRAVPSAESLIIVPALAFDTRGYRLGYGKGYYDRYLAENLCSSIGIAYSECVCNELPSDIYDRKINCLITDRSVYYFD